MYATYNGQRAPVTYLILLLQMENSFIFFFFLDPELGKQVLCVFINSYHTGVVNA